MGKVEVVSYPYCSKESENMPRKVRGVHHTTVMDKATSLRSRCQHVCSSLLVLPPYFTLSQNLIKFVTLRVARVVTHVTGVYLQAQSMDDGTLCPEDGQGKYVQTEERTILFESKYPCLSDISEAVEMVGGQGSLLAARVGTLASYERTLQRALAMS